MLFLQLSSKSTRKIRSGKIRISRKKKKSFKAKGHRPSFFSAGEWKGCPLPCTPAYTASLGKALQTFPCLENCSKVVFRGIVSLGHVADTARNGRFAISSL